MEEWFATHVYPRFAGRRDQARALLAEDEKVQQIIRLVGEDVLPDDQRLTVFCAFLIKNGYLQQSAFGADSYYPPEAAFGILDLILHFLDKAREMVKRGVPLSLLTDLEEVLAITHLRELPEDQRGSIPALKARLDARLDKVGLERMAKSGGTTSWR